MIASTASMLLNVFFFFLGFIMMNVLDTSILSK